MTEINRRFGQLEILTREDMQLIHDQALELLETTGIKVEHERALELLAGAGAEVNFESQVVKFSPQLVEDALEHAPRKITLAARNPQYDVVLEPKGRMYSRNTGGMSLIRDVETDQVRDVSLEDTAAFTRLIDGLEHFSFVAPIYAMDVPDEIREMVVLETMIHNTEKHVNIRVLTSSNLQYLVDIGLALAGGEENFRARPMISLLEGPIPPLRFPDVMVEALLLAGKYNIPIEICSMPNVGATGPMTLAGSFMLSMAEHLASFVVGQVEQAGTPIIWAPRYVNMDMSSGLSGMSVEGALLCGAAVQMANDFYNMVCDLHGPANNAILPDGQAGIEGSFAFITGMVGPTVLCGGGGLELGLVASMAQLVFDHEIHAVVRRALEGFTINRETLGLDAIQRAGIGGNFLMDELTLKYMRSEKYFSRLLKPFTRTGWEEAGSKDFTARAKDIVRDILANHHPAPLETGAADRIKAVIAEAKDAYGIA